MPPTVALCAIMRNEGRYVLEWIAYHRGIGFGPVVIYDNLSDDGMARLCEPLARAGIIEYVPWPDPPPGEEHGPQVYAYRHAAARLQADWLCFLDADEFLVLDAASTVQEFLLSAGQAAMPIALNWRIFGSGGAQSASPGLVTDRFVRCGGSDRPVNAHIKTIGPMSALAGGARVHIHGWPLGPGQHYVDATGEPVEVEGSTWLRPARWRGAWVNHYIVKSREEFEHKRTRGNASVAPGRAEKFTRTLESYFTPYDANEDEDRTVQRFRGILADELRRLERVVEVG